jgi:hypothetical protein
MEFAVRGGLKMDRIRLIAALTNGVLVLMLYTVAWGTPALDIAMLELSLAVGAGVSTWYALRGIRRYRA